MRVFAPQPDGSALTLWADPARTAEELRARSGHDAEAYPRFDARVRALASFLAYLYAATPPDMKSPSFADAMSGVRIGNAFRRLGRKASREATRAMPMAIADYVAESFETALRHADGRALMLELESGKTYRLHLMSMDWLHGFSLQPENINIEVHPNYEHVVTLTPTRAGTYSIICNEYCGINHHTMASKLYVVKK